MTNDECLMNDECSKQCRRGFLVVSRYFSSLCLCVSVVVNRRAGRARDARQYWTRRANLTHVTDDRKRIKEIILGAEVGCAEGKS